MDTKFCFECGGEIHRNAEICVKCGVRQTASKDRTIAILLALFLGGFGMHKFYLNQNKQGFIYLLFCWTFIPYIFAIVDSIIYMSKSDSEFADWLIPALEEKQHVSEENSYELPSSSQRLGFVIMAALAIIIIVIVMVVR